MLAQPLVLLDLADVRDLESDPGRIELAQARHDIGSTSSRRAEHFARNGRQTLLSQAVKFGSELGIAFRGRSQRIERDGEMPVAADRIHELSRGGDIAKKSGIELSRLRRLSNGGWCRSASDSFRKSEKLAPRFVY